MSLPRYPEYKNSGVEWLGEVPAHWAITRVQDVAKVINGYPFDARLFEADSGYSLLRIRDLDSSETVTRYNGQFVEEAAVTSADILIGMDGDFNVGRWLGDGPALLNQRMCCIRTERGNLATLLRYALPTPLKAINDVTYATTVKHLSSFQVQKLRIALPCNESELSAIATFLDRETGKIDDLIAEQEKLLTLLAEKRQATISHAVTKGLNPDAPMKASGVAWLGDVPEHWIVVRMKRVIREGIAGPYGSSLTKSMYTTSGYRVYGQQQVIPNDFSVGDYYISEEKFSEMSRYLVKPDDILISVMGTIGRAALVPQDVEPGIINPRLVLYRAREEVIAPRYLQVFINNPTSQKYFSLAAQGTTMEGLNMVSIGELQISLPTLDEQREILEFINAETERLDALRSESERTIALLKERRSALIAAAVTGQIDVRGLVTEPEAA